MIRKIIMSQMFRVIKRRDNKEKMGIKISVVVLLSMVMGFVECYLQVSEVYTEQVPIATQFEVQPYRLVFSPDFSSLAYMPGPQNNCRYIKFRTSVWNNTQTSVDASRVVSLAFGSQGQRLYVLVKNSTKYYVLRYYQVKNFQISQTSEWLLDINVLQSQFFNSIITVSDDGKIAVSINQIVYALTLSANGTSVDQKVSIFMSSIVYDIQWHHIQTQTLFIGAYSADNSTKGEFCIYNSTSRSRTGHLIGTKGIGIMTDGSVLILSNGTSLNLYNYQQQDIQLQISISNYDMNSTSVFPDRTSFITWSNNGDIKLYKVIMPSPSKSSPILLNSNFKNKKVQNQQSSHFTNSHSVTQIQKPQLKILLSKSSAVQLSFAGISHDANQIYFYKQNKTNLIRWSLCSDGLYFQNNQCFNCSNQCKTCQFSMSECTSCREGEYLTENKECKKCSDLINFCESCSFLSNSVNCDKCSVGFVYSKDTKKCVCPDGYEFKTTTTCQKKFISPNDGNVTGVEFWQLLLGLSAVVILNLLACFGVYWMIHKRVRKYEKLLNQDDKEEKRINERMPPASILSERDQIRQRLINEGR